MTHYHHAEVVIVGGGLIGCSIAWHLTQRGVRPLLLEAESVGSQASFAGAGMLGAQVEMHEPGPLFELGVTSRKGFREFCETLREATGIDPEYVPEGIVRIASSQEEAGELQRRAAWQRERGLKAEWWSPDDVRANLGYEINPCEGALYLPDDHRVEAPRLARALARAAILAGADVREGEPVVDVEAGPQGILVSTPRNVYAADRAVIAAGAWSSVLLRRFEWSGRVYPVKGEAVSLQATAFPLRKTVFANDIYMIPKNDGRLYLGATEVPEDWSRGPSTDGLARLTDRAAHRIANLRQLTVAEVRVGLRPVSDDGLPYLGPLPGLDNLWIASGHARNGILLTPVTGQLIAEGITTGKLSPLLQPFSPARARGREAR
ncbi:MAG: glycine oxidase ThiO [Alicyclobacillaceae bacterium]|nr:glycine oxidase ThiO [Alicyclobacillaceae bacterium]